MKVLFIIPEYYPHSGGGISTYYLHYIKALKPYCEKIKVIVGSGYDQRNEDYTLDGVEIAYLKPEIYNRYSGKFSKFDLLPEFKRNMAAAWAMHEQANEGEGFDLVECAEFGLGFIPWIIKHDKPVITRLHGSTGQIALNESERPDSILSDFTRQTELLFLPLCDKLITYSKANQVFWNKVFNDENVIKIDPVFSTTTDQPLPLSARGKDGLVTARVQQWKGPVQLCEALSKLKADEMPPIDWIGRDMPFNDKESTADYLKEHFPSIWNKHIVHQDPLPNEQVKALQQKAKFGIIPSTWDMFNFTCLEFLSVGTPVICSDGAGCSDLIEHGKNGFKYSAIDTGALAECLRQMNKISESEYYKISSAGIDTITNKLSPDRLIPLNIAQYESAISNFKAKSSNQFLDAMYLPSDKEYHIKDVLDALPLKRLVNYVSERMKSKIGLKR